MDETSQSLGMGAFKHVVVPVGVVIGLGVARIVASMAQYVQKHESIRFSVAHAVWTTALFLIFVGLWWVLWGIRGIEAERWSFFTLIYLLVGPALIYLPSILLLPEVPDAGELDLHGLLDRVARPVFLCVAAYGLWLAGTELILLRQPFLAPQRAFQGVVVTILLVGAMFPSRRMTTIVGAVTLVVVAVSWGTVRARLI